MNDNLIRWSHCSPVRVRAKQPEPIVLEPKIKVHKACPKSFRYAPNFLEQSEKAAATLNRQIQNQLGSQLRFNGSTFSGLLGGL